MQKASKADGIETDRLLLRPLRQEDIDPLFDIQSDPTAMKYTICTKTREETERRLQAHEKERSNLGFAPWVILVKAEDKVIGWGGLTIDPFDPGWGVEIAYFFHPDYWGRGFGSELVRVSIREGFSTHRLRELHAFAHRDNAASIRVLEKNGFRFLRYEPKLNRNHYLIQKPS